MGKASGWHAVNDLFRKVANAVSDATGTPWAFIIAASIIVSWALTGPIFAFSDTWQLVINTGTTIVTFLMVFLIQNTQNRDARAMHLKLDELIRGVEGARTNLVDLEDLPDDELDALQAQFERIRRNGRVQAPRNKDSSEQDAELGDSHGTAAGEGTKLGPST
ncbi:MAG: putative small integral rane protein [Chloroflexi bacterium]|nr:putative small integral rane protein [Chloroflexota bacterium]